MKQRLGFGRASGSLVMLLLGLTGVAASVGAQEPSFAHDAVSCVVPGEYPILVARVDASATLMAARAYFRADGFPSFYYVDMKPSERDPNERVAVIPKPSAATTRIVYYLESVDVSFNAYRTLEYPIEIREACEDAPVTELVPTDPGIVVGATEAGASALPPGFETAGVVGAITAAGMSSAIGGGTGAGVAIGVGAGIAAGVGGAVVATQGGEPEPSPDAPSSPGPDVGAAPPPSTPPASSGGGSTPPPPAPPVNVTACFSNSPSSLTIEAGESMTFDGSCSAPGASELSFSWDFGGVAAPSEDTRVRVSFPDAGNYPVELEVRHESGASDRTSKTITVVPPPPPNACFTTATLNACRVKFDAKCSLNVEDESIHSWVVDPGGIAGGPYFNSSPAPIFNVDFMSCSGETISATLSITGPNGSDSITQSVVLPNNPQRTDAVEGRRTVPATLTSHLVDRAGRRGPSPTHGRIVVNDSVVIVTDASRPFQHQLRARAGVNRIVAVLGASSGRELEWRFAFPAGSALRPGSLRVEHGQVLRRDARSVVFRFAGTPGERVQFTFALDP